MDRFSYLRTAAVGQVLVTEAMPPASAAERARLTTSSSPASSA